MATAIFYASSTGNTAHVMGLVSKELNGVEMIDIRDDGIGKINEFDKIIFGISTWGEGDLQDDWEEVFDDFSEIDFSGKTVALVGLGDQDSYEEYFLDAMGTIYTQVTSVGAKVVGSWSTDGYEYDESEAIVDDMFVGLAIDEDNQNELTDERVSTWCDQIKGDIL